jgi:flavin reductase (DIM6/NTAB) family NADH-FMN oxidoreductase RutF
MLRTHSGTYYTKTLLKPRYVIIFAKERNIMNRYTIDIAQLNVRPHHLFHNKWAVLAAGDYSQGEFNAMTIGWGALGTMWSKPFVFVAVRHSRYTYTFMEKFNTFTITVYSRDYHEALSLLGTRSGRDCEKVAESGLTPMAAELVTAPVFAEAELALECKKTYANDLNPAHFLDPFIDKHYPNKDFHRIYYGEIVHTSAVEAYIADEILKSPAMIS